MKKKPKWHGCNVVDTDGTHKRLWHFRVRSNNVALLNEHAALGSEKLPPKVLARGWQNNWKPRLDIGWLPADDVFLRVVELPTDQADEIPGMLEFQLEKLTPLSVAQTVWKYLPLGEPENGSTRVVVIIASRPAVEARLGRLEEEGCRVDRLELPLLDELLALQKEGDGLWLLPEEGEETFNCLTAWVMDGRIRGIGYLRLPVEGDWQTALRNQLVQIVWTGELEGWVSGVPKCHLIADEALSAQWTPVLREFSGTDVVVRPRTAPDKLATLTASRAAVEATNTSLLPPEYAARYRQEHVDKLWMRSLGTLLLVYLFGTLVYFVALEYLKFQRDDVQLQARNLGNSYTNSLQLKARVQILQDQVNLRYAALESWLAAASNLPEGMTLTQISFSQGRQLNVYGVAPGNDPGKITEYVSRLQKATVNGQPLFASVTAPNIRSDAGRSIVWNFTCELANPEGGQ